MAYRQTSQYMILNRLVKYNKTATTAVQANNYKDAEKKKDEREKVDRRDEILSTYFLDESLQIVNLFRHLSHFCLQFDVSFF